MYNLNKIVSAELNNTLHIGLMADSKPAVLFV